jgi:hypothetical protein
MPNPLKYLILTNNARHVTHSPVYVRARCGCYESLEKACTPPRILLFVIEINWLGM